MNVMSSKPIEVDDALPEILDEVPAAATPRRNEPKVPSLEEMQLRVDRIASLLQVLGHDAEVSRLYAALALHSGREIGIKDTLGAISAERGKQPWRLLLANMANLGFSAYRVSRERVHLHRVRGSVLAVHEGKSQSVLLPSGDEWIVCNGQGQFSKLTANILDQEDIDYWAFEFESSKSSVSEVARSHSGFSWVRALIARFPNLGRSLLLSTGILALTGILVPLLIAAVFGQVIGLSSLNALPSLAVAFFLIVAVEAVVLWKRTELSVYVANRLEFLINTASFHRILFLSPFISERASPTNQAARLRSFESIRDFLSGPAFSSLLDAPVAFLSILVVGMLAPSVIVVPFIAVFLFLLIFFVAWRSVRILTSKAADEATEMQRLSIETLEKLDAIRESGLQEVWSKRIIDVVDRDQRAQFHLRLSGLVAEACSSFVYISAIIGILAGGAYSVWDGQTSNITLLAITVLSMRSLLPYHSLCLSVQRFEQIRRSFTQINTLMDMPSEIKDDRNDNTIDTLTGRISFVNVGFRAADTRPVLVGLDLEIESGEVIGIYGANGTGKTALFKMILGMIDVSLGTIRIDGVDIRQLPLIELRRRLSYVPQRPRLFPGTLRQNLLHANPLASPDEISRVLEMVGLTERIAAYPSGLEYQVSSDENGDFSMDFKYRFAIARALLVNSNVFLIDELPNVLIDGEIGDLLKRLLREFRGKRTVIFVSHRSDLLSSAQRVIALRYGRVPLVGVPNTIMEQSA